MIERDISIDYAKGMAILLVYIGHSVLYYPPEIFADCAWGTNLRSIISSCNMPLFFFISGLLYAFSKKSNLEVLKDKGRRLLIPYLFTMAIVVVAKQYLPSTMAYKATAGWGILTDVFVKGGDRWFVYVLMWIFLFSLPLRGLKSSKWLLLVIVSALTITLTFKLPDYFLLDNVVWYISFFLLGMFLNQFYVEFRKWNTYFSIVVALVFSLLNIFFVLQLKHIPLMKIAILPITGTIFFMTLAFLIDDACKKWAKEPAVVKYIAYCGKYSLQFYLFTFAYPIIRYVVISVLNITAPLPVFTIVLIMQLIVITILVEITRRVNFLKIPMVY